MSTTHEILTLRTADDPEASLAMRALVARTWPEYLAAAGPAEPSAEAEYFLDILLGRWPELQFVLEDVSGEVIVSGNWAPMSHDGDTATLPAEGWDWALTHASRCQDAGLVPTHGCALAITIAPEHQGKGLAYVALTKMRELAAGEGLAALYAPVRPNHKERFPLVPMSQYITRRRADGHLEDPWMRVHEKLGAHIVGACERSMRLGGRPSEWSTWCQADLSSSGAHVLPRMLSPLEVDLEADWAVYTEPNVWMVHPL